MKKIKITEQIHVLGTTFKDIYEIADYSHNGISKDGVYVGQLVRHHFWFDECDYLRISTLPSGWTRMVRLISIGVIRIFTMPN